MKTGNSYFPHGNLKDSMSCFFWKPAAGARRAQRQVLRAQRAYFRAQAHAMRARSPFRMIFALVWLLFWIGLAVWLIAGGPEARQAFVTLTLGLVHWVRDTVVNVFGLMQ